MNSITPFIVIGLATGAAYGLAGIGLVLTYKTSGIFNFGYGAVAAVIAFAFYFLYEDLSVPWPIACAVCLFVVAPLIGLVLEVMARSLADASETVKVVATVGLILIVTSIGWLWHPLNAPTFPHFLSQSTVAVLGVQITWEQVITFVVSAVAAGGLYWFFRYVRFGIVMRGVVDNADLVAMGGDDPVAVRRWAWIVGSIFAGIAGLLLGPGQLLDGATITTLVFAAFGAAAIGYFSNLPLTFVGGLIVGVAAALVSKYAATVPMLGGLPPALPFVVLFVALIVLPRRLLVQRRLVAVKQIHRAYHAPTPVRLVAGAIAIGLLALVPVVQASKITVWSAALINVILFLSLGLLVRRSGQISLCQLAFAAVGSAAFAHFSTTHGLPWLLAMLLATLVVVPVGLLIAIPAVRVSGVFLALATLGFGVLMEQVFYTRDFMFGQSMLGIAASRPQVTVAGLNLASDRGFYYLVLVIAVLVVLTVTALTHGRLGRLMDALSDSPLALETHGTTSSMLKVIVFCLTSAMASLAGALTAQLYYSGVGTYFPAFTSLTLVALVVIVTVGAPWYAIVGAVTYSVIPAYLTGHNTTTILNLLFGLGAVGAAYSTHVGGTPAAVQRFLSRFGRHRGNASRRVVEPPSGLLAESASTRTKGRSGLEVRDLSVRFGGVMAVNQVSLSAPMGTITGLIGPNGAGKTTTFNACSGLVRPSAGSVLLHGDDVTGAPPPVRARRGLGRTFQRTELFDSLTVRQNVAMGCEAPLAGGNPLRQVFGSRSASKRVAAATDQALALTGTTALADVQVGLLSIGQRRLVELARSVAGPFDFLLLDEPSSGLDGHESEEFGAVLRTVVEQQGRGILLVEHDMSLVREVCDRVYVLDFGSLLFEGSPAEMESAPEVRTAYLGQELQEAVPAGSMEQ